jgi:hypothetical protein
MINLSSQISFNVPVGEELRSVLYSKNAYNSGEAVGSNIPGVYILEIDSTIRASLRILIDINTSLD